MVDVGCGHTLGEMRSLAALGAYCRQLDHCVRRAMRYRDIEYTVVQGIKRDVWKWSTSVAGTEVSGREPSKAAAMVAVEKAIDRALVSKRMRLVQPRVPQRPPKVSERAG